LRRIVTAAAAFVTFVALVLVVPDEAGAATRTQAVRSGATYARQHGYTVGIAVLDTKTGRFYGAGRYKGVFASESIVKVFIATRLLVSGKMHGRTRSLAYTMITRSDDGIASALYGRVGGDSLIAWVKKHYHVPALGYRPSRPGWWGNTHIRPAGLVRLYARLKADRKVGPWLLNAMHHATKYGSDGTYQFFGLPSATSHAAVKQGWGNDLDWGNNADFNTTGFVNHDRYAVAILARGPISSYGSGIGTLLTQVARRLLPGGQFPDPWPAIRYLTKTSGGTSGGTTLTVHGNDLTQVTAVRFGTRYATHLQRLSPYRVRVVTPAHAAGTVAVEVLTGHGASVGWRAKRYEYIAAPTVTHVSPATGPTAGGTVVSVRGSGFYPGTRVLFGRTAGTSVRITDRTTLAVRAPAHAAGAVHITLITPYGTSTANSASSYTYAP
jgi:hypothetical protein